MIQAEFDTQGGRLSGFSVSGHAMFADAGEDIVCAAVSSAVYMAANTLTEILRLRPQIDLEEGRMRIAFRSPDEIQRAQDILKGLQLHLTQLASDYPNNIAVKLRGVKNA